MVTLPPEKASRSGDAAVAQAGVGGELEHGANARLRLVGLDGQVAVDQGDRAAEAARATA